MYLSKQAKILLLGMLLTLPMLLKAQYSETISTDRPGQAIGTSAVGKSTAQIQTGLNTNFMSWDDDYKSRTLLSNTVIRIGIIERLEINGTFNYQADKIEMPADERNTSGVSSTELGARLGIIKNEGAIPALGLQGSLLLKAQSPEYQRDKLGTKIILSTGNTINNWLSVNTNLGLSWDGNGNGAQSLYVLNFSLALTDRIGAVAEIYGSFNEFDANYDAGISYLINNNFLLDVSAGWQGDDGVSDWFIDGGISFRIDWRE
jgi:hypothetical protein